MTSIRASARAYENWMRTQLGEDLVEADLEEKHRKMRKGAFPFLRATYWRWAETILEIRPEIAEAPRVLSIGDTHLENFGTWRDIEGRLIWGANDFDDAAIMPWPLDILRLAVSALLARGDGAPTADAICAALRDGYAEGLAHPAPVVLERDHAWLREAVVLPEAKRAKFWSDLEALEPQRARRRYRNALRAAMPDPDMVLTIAPRQAGTGSLGRPRFVAHGTWLGGPAVREAKALLLSAWSRCHARRGTAIRTGEIAAGRHRATDPQYRVLDDILVRRLSPNSRKIEVKDEVDLKLLLSREMLALMGREIAACHADDRRRLPGLEEDLRNRDAAWLREAAEAVAEQVAGEHKEFARHGR
ncbi:DUF2252 domain-containing protein [Roseomonas hellenica]|uniref:DUF2252 domain-containing protein n=1 Tax=Plastoroseomonas hellenica TaxID=2687306 RepID=A0ABS5EUB0_9PROT|nr:DUF2252 family protein [Plastoroseomonas hellenica]MBR0663867.1 DUF2252 domain-containing protein [Plastoroseomonas hellenica]